MVLQRSRSLYTRALQKPSPLVVHLADVLANYPSIRAAHSSFAQNNIHPLEPSVQFHHNRKVENSGKVIIVGKGYIYVYVYVNFTSYISHGKWWK